MGYTCAPERCVKYASVRARLWLGFFVFVSECAELPLVFAGRRDQRKRNVGRTVYEQSSQVAEIAAAEASSAPVGVSTRAGKKPSISSGAPKHKADTRVATDDAGNVDASDGGEISEADDDNDNDEDDVGGKRSAKRRPRWTVNKDVREIPSRIALFCC